MTAFIIIVLIGLIFFILSNNKRPTPPTNILERRVQEKSNELHQESNTDYPTNFKLEEISTNPIIEFKDDSIIDVTTETYTINPLVDLKKYNIGVPYWTHHYIYSYSEINSATNQQKKFYTLFKGIFLNGIYLDLEGNTNYAFILLFDFLEEYEIHKDISKLETQLFNLGQYYPKTKPYCISFLRKKKEEVYKSESAENLKVNDGDYYHGNNFDLKDTFEPWQLGTKYKQKLQLNNKQVVILNQLIDTNNKFNSIEFCATEIIRLFFAIKNELELHFIKNGSTLESQIKIIAEPEVSKFCGNNRNGMTYRQIIFSHINSINQCFYKNCENALRDYFSVGRKTNLNNYLHSLDALVSFNTIFSELVTRFLEIQLSILRPIDLESEIPLNNYDRNRYKEVLNKLETDFNEGKIAKYIDGIYKLEKTNLNNPFIENVFYRASEFIAKYDKIESLKFYLIYIFYDLKSTTFDNKQLSKTTQKSLFITNEQFHDFGIIIRELINDKDLDKAVNAVSKIYSIKRKTIQLDETAIKEAQQQHIGTVELLNKYLEEEFEDDIISTNAHEIKHDDKKIEISQKNIISRNSIYTNEIVLSPIQIDTLGLFQKSNLSIPQSDLEVYAKSKGVFKNQLIESINEICYVILDDVLIEEEDEHYSINPNYHQRILAE